MKGRCVGLFYPARVAHVPVSQVFVAQREVAGSGIREFRVSLRGDRGVVVSMCVAPQVRAVEVVVVAISLGSLQLVGTRPYAGVGVVGVGKSDAVEEAVLHGEGAAVLLHAEESGVFCKSILSTKIDSDVTGGKTVVLTSSREYEDYLDKYDDISVVEPEQVPIVEDWFSAGYYAIVVSTDQYELPVNLTASAKYVDTDGNVKILVGPSDINPEFIYSQDLDSCKQASVVIFLDQELITDAPSITIMLMQ